MATATSPRRRPTPPAPSADSPETVADLLRRLGSIPARRVRLRPTPGTATEADLVRENESKLKAGLYELVEGTLVEKARGVEESEIALLIAHYLLTFILPRKPGMLTGADRMTRTIAPQVRLPDVAFLSRARFPGGKRPRGAIAPIAPDLAVEVLSKSNTKAEIDRKLREYFASGTRLAWIVAPKTWSVRVHTSPVDSTRLDLASKGVLDGCDVLPGFRLPLADLFADRAE
jgi:Uma2 family endonuclease